MLVGHVLIVSTVELVTFTIGFKVVKDVCSVSMRLYSSLNDFLVGISCD